MDFQQLKIDIKEISEIASSAPEPFRNKCFEVLLSALLVEQGAGSKRDGGKKDDLNGADETKSKKPPAGSPVLLNSQLRVLLRKTGVTEDELNKIVLVENDEVHFIQEPHPDKIRDGQLEWSLLMALKNAILKNAMETDPEEVRSKCIDAGFYDKANFAANFKSPKFKNLFKEVLASQGEPVALAPAGQDALGDLIKRLASEAK
jgi:hypothetical protein